MRVTSPAVRVQGLRKRYPSFREPVDALVGVDFDVAKGDVFGFLGPNGAGKTTTLRILATVLAPTGGSAEVDGHDVVRDPMAVRTVVGYMPERSGAYPLLTGLQNLVYWGRLQDVDGGRLRERAQALLAELGLEEAADRKVKTYSHGMAKRLLMAQALIHDPRILLLDEPAGGLDPQGIRFFRDLVRRLQGEGKTIFLSSHILSEVEQTCTTVGIIHRGKMVVVDRMDALRQRIGEGAVARIEIACDPPPPAAMQAILAVPKVRAAHPTPEGIVVEAEAGAEVADEVTTSGCRRVPLAPVGRHPVVLVPVPPLPTSLPSEGGAAIEDSKSTPSRDSFRILLPRSLSIVTKPCSDRRLML